MAKTKGRVTLPSEGNFLEQTKEMMERWGADALRDSDGTKLPEEVKALDATIYTTYFVARGHNGAYGGMPAAVFNEPKGYGCGGYGGNSLYGGIF